MILENIETLNRLTSDAGVYVVTVFVPDGAESLHQIPFYVGQSSNVNRRWKTHTLRPWLKAFMKMEKFWPCITVYKVKDKAARLALEEKISKDLEPVIYQDPSRSLPRRSDDSLCRYNVEFQDDSYVLDKWERLIDRMDDYLCDRPDCLAKWLKANHKSLIAASARQ